MVVVPADTAVTKPLTDIVATEVLLELHAFEVAAVPLPVNCDVAPIQMEVVPEMVGFGFTITVSVTEHPRLFVYVIMDVPPVTPVTTPVLETVAIPVLAEIHGLELAAVPEPVNCVVLPTQTTLFPVVVGFVLTETVIVVVVAHCPAFGVKV